MFSGNKNVEEETVEDTIPFEDMSISESQQKLDDLFEAINKKCGTLFTQKNIQYGNAIQSTGVLGATVELVGIAARLRVMILKSSDHGASQQAELIDILRDCLIYANIAMQMMADENWTGK